ncbi:MAG TPA: tetratricopeptide repeat protein [Flavobacteriales bacterium]|nr:tetratricopeptide repeat protein [Flavobacteriales bacterium]
MLKPKSQLKRFVLYAFFLCAGNNVYSQDNFVDSLKKEIKSYKGNGGTLKKDTSYINLLSQIGRAYQGINIDTAFLYHNEIVSLSQKLLSKATNSKNTIDLIKIKQGEAIRQLGWDFLILGHSDSALSRLEKALALADNILSQPLSKKASYFANKFKASTLCNLGTYFDNIGGYRKAVMYFDRAIKIGKRIKSNGLLFAAIGNKGLVHHRLGDLDSAIACFNQSIPLCIKEKNDVGLANTYINISLLYTDKGNYKVALDYLFKALKLGQKINHYQVQSSVLNNIGNLYHYQKQLEKATEYYTKARVLAGELNNLNGEIDALLNLGIVYFDQRKTAEAVANYNKAIEKSLENGNTRSLAKGISELGSVYFYLKEYDKAEEHFRRALVYLEEIELMPRIAQTKGNLGQVLTVKGKFVEAEKLLNESLKFGEESKNVEVLLNTYSFLSELYEKTNRGNKAVKYYKLHIQLRDSLQQSENLKATLQKELQFNYEKKAMADSIANAKKLELKNVELAKNKAEVKAKRNQQMLLYGGLGLALIFAFFMYNRFKITKRQNKIIEEQKREVESAHMALEERNAEVMDSIRYAKRIQQALLANDKFIDKQLKRLRSPKT